MPVTITETPTTVEVTEGAPSVVEVIEETFFVEIQTVGPQGRPGDPGPAGSGEFTFVYQQVTPASIWTVTHSLGGFPSVTTVDSTGRVVLGSVEYLSGTQVRITFSSAFSGKVYCS